MDKEQNRKFEEWWREFDKTRTLEMSAPRTIAQKAWKACLGANKVEEISNQPWLGNATTKEMLEELMARAEVHGYANYRTVDGGVSEKLEAEPEPSPTEMVKRLLEKGWTVEAYPDTDMTFFRSPDGKNRLALIAAYHQVFPRKKKVEVEVYRHKKTKSFTNNGKNPYMESSPHYKEWEKGIATFWVEEEQPCTSEDGSS